MREMKDSGIEWIGEVPKRWEISKIKYLVDNSSETAFLDGDWIESPYITDDGIPYFTTKNVGDGYFKKSKHDYITQETFKLLNCKYAHANDLVISRLNEPYGRSCILPDDEQNCVLAVDLVILRPKATVDKRYVCYVTQTKGYQNSVKDTARGTTMKRISRTNLGNINIPMPPINIQYQIADYLDEKCVEIDTLVSEIEKQIETFGQYKKSVITEAVTKGLDPNIETKDSEIDWIGKVPKKWSLTKIGMLYILRAEKVSDKDYSPLSVTMKGIVPQIETAAKTSDGDNRKLVRKGDFVINSRSDRRGACGISKYDGSVSLINTVLAPRSNMEPQYYNWLFQCPLFSDEFYRWGHGIVDDLWTTNWQDMKNITLPVPPLEEQQYIANYLDRKCAEIDTVIANKKEQLETLTEYKKSLIYEYVTGKKEVPEQ